MTKEHCRDLFDRFDLDTSDLDKYGNEITQSDLDELTGYNLRIKELNSLHEVWRTIGIIAGTITMLFVALGIIKHVKTA